ncbi:unnamed protein product [Cylicocyclus nassatus]|uniref:Secreted protein n=1 Tax=Cylicocyclus nassatus TaxID=53992 RepID=A0AA36DMP4_CYLNA|nr:unnamed protein product [Cylicocyclus nassatus]CAJ0589250.1 unnamed protein product [Cylicocyclus nassatus]
MRAWMLSFFVVMLTAMCFIMAEPVPVDATVAESDVSSNVRQKRQYLCGYRSYRTIHITPAMTFSIIPPCLYDLTEYNAQ